MFTAIADFIEFLYNIIPVTAQGIVFLVLTILSWGLTGKLSTFPKLLVIGLLLYLFFRVVGQIMPMGFQTLAFIIVVIFVIWTYYMGRE